MSQMSAFASALSIRSETDGSVCNYVQEMFAHDLALKAYMRNTFPSIRDPEDVVQEAYLRLLKARSQSPIKSFRALLFTVTRRLALDVLRRQRRSPFVPVEDVDAVVPPGRTTDTHKATGAVEDSALLNEAIAALPDRCREIFILCRIEGLAQREVADRLGLAESTVAVQSARGRLRCEAYVRRHSERGPSDSGQVSARRRAA